jgi:lysophospholipase L1-like esterase
MSEREQNIRLTSNRKKLYTFIIIVFITISMLLLVELVSVIMLKIQKEKVFPFLIWSPPQDGIRGIKDQRFNYLDPHLGYSHNHKDIRKRKGIDYRLDGFAVYCNKAKKTVSNSEDVIRIVILGGSTTDPTDSCNWGQQLNDILKEKKLEQEVEIYNGAVSGYSSNQEMIKMLRDGLPLKPKIIICMNGVNEVGFYHSLKRHPMVESYQSRIFDFIVKRPNTPPPLFPNTVSLLKSIFTGKQGRIAGINYGPKVNTTPVDQWKRNIIIMNAIADEFGSEYLCFLQPIMGFGRYNPTPTEVNLLNKRVVYFKGRGIDYLHDVKSFYQPARKISQELDFCIDITDIFQDLNGLYRDSRHPNIKGYRLMAEAVYNELEKRGLLEKEKKHIKGILNPSSNYRGALLPFLSASSLRRSSPLGSRLSNFRSP